MASWRDVEVSVYTNNPVLGRQKPIKVTHIVIFEGEDEQQKAEEALLRLYSWHKGLQYEEIEIVTIKEHKTMANQNSQIEEAQVIEETNITPVESNVEVVEAEEVNNPSQLEIKTVNEKKGEYSTSLALPKFEAPTVFKLDGQVYSVKGAEDIGKEIDKKISQLTEDKFENSKLKEELKALKQKAVKYRTTSKKVLDSAFKPLNEAIKSTIGNCKAIGDKAQAAQDRADAHLKLIENWEEEQETLRLSELSKKTDERIAKLIELGGNYNPTTFIVSFDYAPGTVFNREQIGNLEDSEFDTDFNYVTKLYNEDKERKAAEASEAEQKSTALIEKQRKLRKKELMLEDFDFDTTLNAFVHESGIKVFTHEIDSLSDDDWDARIAKISEPVKQGEVTETPIAPTVVDVDDENPFGDSKAESTPAPAVDPLTSVIAGMVGKHEEHQDKQEGIVKVVLEFTRDNPYFDVMIGRSVMRVSPLEFEDVSNNGIETDDVLGTNVHGELKFTAHKGGSQK